jgi:nitric oxide reductase activation protein
VKVSGSRLTAVVDTRTFDRDVEKTITVETDDGNEVTLRMQFRVPQAMQLSARSLVWKRGAAPTPQVLRITLPKGSPITHIADAALSGDAFDYAPKAVKRGQEYTVTITPRSTAKAALNRLVLTTDSTDPRYHRQIIYLQVKK